ncbi:peptidoglycan biosynthesis protein MviN [Rhodococcus sp. 06-412-2C]|uniref:lipid II flippase MurJ n=1 Tax=unclassified Rhodococcus (in: high G+C Gram-positive bacteria) TaxID=192944 RepID=UPI000B9B27E3|nr:MULTISPECIES: lipid II flippase MurJ [unclassified Rhodococcus (in: high G+C Gram-positive bacteria)]OZC88784.1 peptidoglycan biosynthesis protein MviN [Rhodococcus sp. 06-412-2C]OZD03149.1 peptidoglycan biosynthesis protein MviN [Rhodococcus sp. 06-412-2B]
MTGNVPYDGDLPRSRMPAAQVFRRTTPPRSAPWERQSTPELRSYPAPPPLDGQPAADDAVTQLIPRFRDEDYPQAPSGTVPPSKIPPGGSDPAPQPEPRPQKSLLAASGSIAVATLVSRITGFAKQVAMTATLGAGLASAFTVSTILPNMISELVLGAVLGAIVVPVLVRAEQEDADGGRAFVRRLFTIAVALLGTVALGATMAAPLLARLMLSGDPKVNEDLTISLTYLVLPALLFYGLSGLLTAVLNTRQNFKPGAWAPVFNNLVVLAVFGIYFLIPDDPTLNPNEMSTTQVLVIGLGVTTGVITQVLALIPALRRERIDLRPLWGFDERLKKFGAMAAAIVLYVVISQVGLIVATNIASGTDDASNTIYSQAWIVLQLPYGILGVTVLTAIMPRLSRNAANGDTPSVVDDLSVATRLTMVTLVPIVVFLTFAGPWVGEALYGFGRFADVASRLGEAVSWSAFSLIPYALVLIHLRVFYAREQAWTPTWIILGITAVKIGLSLLAPMVASDPDQVVLLLGTATGLGYTVGAIIGGYLLHKSLGNLRMANVGKTIWLVLIASLAGGAAMLAIDRILGLDAMTNGWIGNFVRVAIDAVVMLGITFSILWFGKIPEVLAVTVALSRVVRRFHGAPADRDADLAAAETGVIPVIRTEPTWDTARDRLPYPGPRHPGAYAHTGRPFAEQHGAYSPEGVTVTDDDVAGGPAQSPANEADRTSGGVEVDTQDRTEPVKAEPKTPAKTAAPAKAITPASSEAAKAAADSEKASEKSADTADAVESENEATTDKTSAEDATTEEATTDKSAATEPAPKPADRTVSISKSALASRPTDKTISISKAQLPVEEPADKKTTDKDSKPEAVSEDTATAPTTDKATEKATTDKSEAAGAAAPAPERTLRGPTLIPGASVAGGRYRLLAPHGGARGLKFWQAHDVKLDREVALTFVDADQQSTASPNDRTEGPQAILSRTLRLGRINSPGLARVLDVVRGSSGGIVVAEWTPGRSLREMADTVPAPTGAARAIKVLAAAAEAAHRSGGALSIDHPDRVRISSSGNAVLAFPATLADADPSSDVRGLGAMLYALITARWPLSDTTGGSVVSGDSAPARSVGGMRPADRDDKGAPLEPRQVRPDVPFEISAVAVRALEQNSGIRTAATVQHVLDQAAVVNDKTDLMPALRLGQRAPGASGHSLADPEEIAAEKAKSTRTNIAIAILGALTVVILAFAGYWLFTSIAGDSTDAPLDSQEFGLTTPAAAPPAGETAAPPAETGGPVALNGVSVFSPQGSADNPSTASNVIDNDPSTAWTTDSYFQQFPALKNGVGLLVTIPATALNNAWIESTSPGTVVEIRSAPNDSPSLSDTTLLGEATLQNGRTDIALDDAEPTGNVLVWITTLGEQGGRIATSISGIGFDS